MVDEAPDELPEQEVDRRGPEEISRRIAEDLDGQLIAMRIRRMGRPFALPRLRNQSGVVYRGVAGL